MLSILSLSDSAIWWRYLQFYLYIKLELIFNPYKNTTLAISSPKMAIIKDVVGLPIKFLWVKLPSFTRAIFAKIKY